MLPFARRHLKSRWPMCSGSSGGDGQLYRCGHANFVLEFHAENRKEHLIFFSVDWRKSMRAHNEKHRKKLACTVCCLFVSYLFRGGHSTDMCSLLQENLLGGKKESVSRSYVHVCWKKVMKMKRFNEEVYTGSPKVNLSCFREFDELERCLRYSDLKKFMVCAGRLFQTSGALLVNESMPGREEGQNGQREFPLPLVWWECSVKLNLVHREIGADFWTHLRTTTANWSAQRCSIDVKRWFFKMGATSACQSAPATQRTARLHTEQRRSRKEVDMPL